MALFIRSTTRQKNDHVMHQGLGGKNFIECCEIKTRNIGLLLQKRYRKKKPLSNLLGLHSSRLSDLFGIWRCVLAQRFI